MTHLACLISQKNVNWILYLGMDELIVSPLITVLIANNLSPCTLS